MAWVLAKFVFCTPGLSMNWWHAWQPLADKGWLWGKMREVWLKRHKSLWVWGDNLPGWGRLGESKMITTEVLILLVLWILSTHFLHKWQSFGRELSALAILYGTVPLHQGQREVWSLCGDSGRLREIWVRPSPAESLGLDLRMEPEGRGGTLSCNRHYAGVAWLFLSKTFWVCWGCPVWVMEHHILGR